MIILKRFAIIENNIVNNLIVCDSKELAEELTGLLCVEIFPEKTASPGDLYDPESDTFILPSSDTIEESASQDIN